LASPALGENYVLIAVDIPADAAIEEVRSGDLARWELAGTRELGDHAVERVARR